MPGHNATADTGVRIGRVQGLEVGFARRNSQCDSYDSLYDSCDSLYDSCGLARRNNGAAEALRRIKPGNNELECTRELHTSLVARHSDPV